MFRPHLKQKTQTIFPQRSKTQMEEEQVFLDMKNDTNIVPPMLMEDHKSHFFKPKPNNSLGILNSCSYSYPDKIIKQFKESEKGGLIQVHSKYFTFIKGSTLYLWEYFNNHFYQPIWFYKKQCSQPITSVTICQTRHESFKTPHTILVAIALGNKIQLHRLKKSSVSAELENLFISIYGEDVITKMKFFQGKEFIYSMNEKLPLFLLFGEATGALSMFDFSTLKKHKTDTFLKQISRKTKGQIQSYTRQIQVLENFIFCLVEERILKKSFIQKVKQTFYSPELNVTDRIEVYIFSRKSQQNSQNCFSNIRGIQHYRSISITQLLNKMKTSFTNSLNQIQEEGLRISSIFPRNNLIQIVFSSGHSIDVDWDLSFSGNPTPAPNKLFEQKPYKISDFLKKQQEKESQQPWNLIQSLGTDIMLYDRGIIRNTTMNYISPYGLKQEEREIEYSLHPISKGGYFFNNMDYLILEKDRFAHTYELGAGNMLILMSTIMLQHEESESHEIPQKKYFDIKLSDLINYYGEVQILCQALTLFIRSKASEKIQLQIRNDIYYILKQELAVGQNKSLKQWSRFFEENQKHIMKNKTFYFTTEVENYIWKNVVLKLEGKSVMLPKHFECRNKHMDAICAAFQILLYQNFKLTEQWNFQYILLNKAHVYETILIGNILMELIDSFLASFKGVLSYDQNRQKKNSKTSKIHYCSLIRRSVEKIVTLIKIYDYFAEQQLQITKLPTLSEIIHNFDENKKYAFCEFLVQKLSHINQLLLDTIDQIIPEIKIGNFRKFKEWKEYCQLNDSQTQDSIIGKQQSQVQLLTDLFTIKIEPQMEEHYLRIRETDSDHNNRMVKFLIALLKKVRSLKTSEYQLRNSIQSYKNISTDYFTMFEFQNLMQSEQQTQNSMNYFIQQADKFINQLFQRYVEQSLSRKQLGQILEIIREEACSEIKEQTQKYLRTYGLNDLQDSFLRQTMISVNHRREGASQKLSSFLSRQLINQRHS